MMSIEKYYVCWIDTRSGKHGRGNKPVSLKIGVAWVEEMNSKYTWLRHSLEKVEEMKDKEINSGGLVGSIPMLSADREDK